MGFRGMIMEKKGFSGTVLIYKRMIKKYQNRKIHRGRQETPRSIYGGLVRWENHP